MQPDAIEKKQETTEVSGVEAIAKKVNPESVGNKIDEKNKDQELGLAGKMTQDKIDNIVNFVENNNALVSEYSVTGTADGHKFEDGGPNAQAIRNQCAELIRDLGQRMVLPVEYQTDYLNTLSTRQPNEILALDRALLVLSQLPQATLDKVSNKLTRDVHTEMVKSGDYRTGGLNAYTSTGTFDMTEINTIQPMPSKTPELTTTPAANIDKIKDQWRVEFKNILPRIDYVLQIQNPKNPKETRQFQKQVNTDGTSKTGWYPITPFTYEKVTQRINVVNLGNQATSKPGWFQNVRSGIVGQGKYDAVLENLNQDEDKNKQIRINASKEYLATIVQNPDPKLTAFITKVETALGKGGFKTFMNETYALGL